MPGSPRTLFSSSSDRPALLSPAATTLSSMSLPSSHPAVPVISWLSARQALTAAFSSSDLVEALRNPPAG